MTIVYDEMTGNIDTEMSDHLAPDQMRSVLTMIHRSGNMSLLPSKLADQEGVHYLVWARCKSGRRVLVAYAFGQSMRARADDAVRVMILRTLVVRKDCRRCGIGRDLVCQMQSCHTEIILGADGDALPFWRSMGFTDLAMGMSSQLLRMCTDTHLMKWIKSGASGACAELVTRASL